MHRRKLVLSIVIAIAIATALWSGHESSLRRRMLIADADTLPRTPDLYDYALGLGRPAFASHCAGCHGADGRGNREPGAPAFTDRDWLYGDGTVAEIEWTVTHGIRAPDPRSWNLAVMPAYASPVPSAIAGIVPLQPAQIRDVADYVLQLAQRPHDDAAASRGNLVFHGPGGCFDCHGLDARGDSAIGAPDLTDAVWLYGAGSREDLIASITRGRRGMCPAWAAQLDAATIRALAVYVYSLSAPDAHTR